jgi:hypothetical protein
MQSYNLVTKNSIDSMDNIANSVKQEILRIMKVRESYFPELRQNEKEIAEMQNQNDDLRR